MTSARVRAAPVRAVTQAVPIALAALGLFAGCHGSDSTGPSAQVTISDLQGRVLQRPLDDRPVPIEIVVTVSDPQRVVGGEGRLQRLQAAADTCQAPGQSPIVATAPITAASFTGNRLRLVLQPRLPAGRSRLCFFVAIPGLAQQPREHAAAETPVLQTNELDLALDVFPARSGAGAGPPAALPVVTIAAPVASAAESPLATGTFRVTRTGATTAALTVSFSVGGTATSGTDYTAIGTSVTIPSGSSTADITITPINDNEGEDSETVKVTLAASAGVYTVGSPSNATVTIASEDQLVRGGGVNLTEGREGNSPCPASGIPTTSSCPVTCPGTFDGTIFEITLARIGSTAAPLDLIYTLDGTARPSFDYFFRPQRQPPGQPTQRVVTFPAGASEVKVCIITVADGSHDAEQRATVILSILPDPAYTIGTPSTRTLTIVDDD